jgi:hypothetical protein
VDASAIMWAVEGEDDLSVVICCKIDGARSKTKNCR